MAEVLVIGKKISEMGLVNEITGEEKIPTSALGDKAVTTDQLLTYVNNNGVGNWGRIGGDINNQVDLQNQFTQQLTALQNHIQDEGNPHNVTKEQVGLGSVDNTADMDKPVSTAVQEALSLKADQTYVDNSLANVDDSLANKTHNSLLGRDADGAHPASAILDGSGVTQQQVNDLTGAPYRTKAGGYTIGERVVLGNGDVVKSTVSGNTANPNVNMTGWFNESASQRKTADKTKRDNETIYDHGAIGDGTLHTVEEWYTAGSTYYNPKYTNLASVQADYPFVNNKDFSIDQAAILKLANKRGSTGGGTVDLSEGHFILKPINDSEMVLVPSKVTIAGRGDATVVESITDATDSPNTAVYWDMFLFKGAQTIGGGVRDLIVRQTGGRRSNAGAIVQRQGANRQKFKNIKFESAIASCIAAEGNVTAEVFTGTEISGCEFRPNGRHGVYLIGSYGNTVINNIFHVSALESIAVRAFSDNLIENNTFLGVVGVDAHAITLAQPPAGQAYKISNLRVKGNRAFNLRGAFFYGQGLGTQLYDSLVSGNFASQAIDYTGTAHVFQFYRTERCDLSGNSIGFARNRAMQLYGCKGNDLSKTTVKNANDAGASVGAIILTSYTDPIEGIETHSTGNTFSKSVFIDERTPAKHFYAIQCLSGSNGNSINRNTYIGGGATRINSVDGLNKQNLGYGLQLVNFTGVVTGAANPATTLSTPLGVGQVYPVSDCYLQAIRMTIGGLVISGEITAKILLNGAVIRQIVFTANNASRFAETIFQPNQNPIKQTDYLGVTLEHSGVSMSASSLNVSIDIVLSE